MAAPGERPAHLVGWSWHPRPEKSYGVVSEWGPFAQTRYAPFAALGCPIFEPSSKNKKSLLEKNFRGPGRALKMVNGRLIEGVVDLAFCEEAPDFS
jgi:hypothetical protein